MVAAQRRAFGTKLVDYDYLFSWSLCEMPHKRTGATSFRGCMRKSGKGLTAAKEQQSFRNTILAVYIGSFFRVASHKTPMMHSGNLLSWGSSSQNGDKISSCSVLGLCWQCTWVSWWFQLVVKRAVAAASLPPTAKVCFAQQYLLISWLDCNELHGAQVPRSMPGFLGKPLEMPLPVKKPASNAAVMTIKLDSR